MIPKSHSNLTIGNPLHLRESAKSAVQKSRTQAAGESRPERHTDAERPGFLVSAGCGHGGGERDFHCVDGSVCRLRAGNGKAWRPVRGQIRAELGGVGEAGRRVVLAPGENGMEVPGFVHDQGLAGGGDSSVRICDQAWGGDRGTGAEGEFQAAEDQ